VINRVSIKNFQSHKNTEIRFENGVNVITGSSDQGKSAILRSLLWVIFSRPLSTDSIVSHWAADEKGKITGEMAVTVETDKGVCIRRRTSGDNEYILRVNGKEKVFKAVNKDVPADIQDHLRLNPLNIQQQHDSPFLLSASASDVAKYFNKIVRLDVIDDVLSNAESARRDTNKKIKETENEKQAFEKQLENYTWIESAREAADKLSRTGERIKIYTDDFDRLLGEFAEYKAVKKELAGAPDIKKARMVVEKIEDITIDYESVDELEKGIEKYEEALGDTAVFEMIMSGKDTVSEIDVYTGDIMRKNSDLILLQKEIDEYTKNKKLSDMGFDKKQALNLIREIEAIQPEYDKLRELNMQIEEYGRTQYAITGLAKEITDLKGQMPAVCPECGQPIMECGE
jgi:exonuclease SbcC